MEILVKVFEALADYVAYSLQTARETITTEAAEHPVAVAAFVVVVIVATLVLGRVEE